MVRGEVNLPLQTSLFYGARWVGVEASRMITRLEDRFGKPWIAKRSRNNAP
jgi:hypothetical protein